jgi:hypothetical protein
MSKINPTVKPAPKMDVNTRLAGGNGMAAAVQSNIALLRRAVLANLLWEDIAYMDGKKVADEIKRLIPLCDAGDVYNLAREARLVQKLRHTPLFIAVEMCKHPNTRVFVDRLLPEIITRADMLTDFVALYWQENGKNASLCNKAKKGLAEAFHNFNEYKFAKYDRDAEVKLRDVMFLCHPKPVNEYEENLFKKIADRTLATPDTWEVALSAGKDKKATWERLITENKLGGKAMLMNMNNMKSASVDRYVIEEGLKNLNGTMLLPLDFLKAAKYAPEFKSQISDAMVNSYKNLPKLPGRTLFIVDISGSMRSYISGKSEFDRMQVAEAMAMLAANQCERCEIVATAGNDWSRVHASKRIEYPEKGFGLMGQIDGLYHELGGGGIFTRQCLEWCEKQSWFGKGFDRVIVFSDSQDCDINNRTPKPFGKYNYICDVSAHTKGINYKGVWTAEISGWSEHFLTYIAAYEGIENTFESVD